MPDWEAIEQLARGHIAQLAVYLMDAAEQHDVEHAREHARDTRDAAETVLRMLEEA